MTEKKLIVAVLLIVLVSSVAVAFWLARRRITIVKSSTLTPVVWTFQRPNQTVTIDEKLNATCVEDGLLTLEWVHIGSYAEEYSWNYVTLGLEMKGVATRLNVFIDSVNVFFHGEAFTSEVDLVEPRFDFKNLSLVEKVEGANASVKLKGEGRPSSVYAKALATWHLYTPNEQDDQMEITYEIIYYNGTVLNKVVQPFQLNIQDAEG